MIVQACHPTERGCIYLYTTLGCHLCEQAEAMLALLPAGAGAMDVIKVEISEQDLLLERYGIRIPVLGATNAAGRWCELGWPFDITKLNAFLDAVLATSQG